MVSLAGAGGGIGEAPSNTQLHGHARTPSSPSNALDKFMRALLPQSSFPSSLSHHHNSGEGDGNVAGAIAKGGEEAALYGQGQDLARTTSSSSSLLRQPSDIPPDAAVYSVSTASSSPTSKSRIKVPRASIGEGKAAHAHRHNLSIDDSSKPTKAPMATITRTRSKTGVANASVARAASPASFYAGGIGESPARSRQNSSSSLGATNLASSMFSHRQTSSSSTQQETPTLGLKGSKIGSSRLNSASTNNASSNIPSETVSPPNNNALPSIRGYTSFPEAINASSTRPRTPLLDPFMRSRVPPQPSTSGYGSETYSSNEAPRLGLLNDEPGPSNSYVASLAMAPLVSRPTQGGQPLYIAGGRTPDTLHAAPSSTYSTPNLHSSPAMQFTGSSHTMPKLNAAVPFSGGGTATRTGTLDSNAGLGLTPSASAGHSRPGMRHRSSSVDSYLRHDGQPALEEDLDGRTRRHERQHSSGLAGLTSFFHLRGSNSEDKGTSLSRRRSSKSRSRKGSLSNTVNTGQSGKLSSRFVHYGQPSPASRPRTPQSETRARQRSSSFGAVAPRDYQFPGRDSPTHPGTGSVAETRGRLPREYDNSRSNSAVTANSSLGRRKEEKRVRNKLISARLPENISHRDARLPSQPLGFTWICGSSSAARTPSFYEEFDYSAFPGGRRKRSMSRSTITQRNYATTGAGDSRTGSRAGVGRGSEDLAYDSEPEFLARRRARNAAGNETRGATQVDEQTQTESLEGPYPTKAQVPHLTFPTGGGALLTSQEEEKALRRRSQSLVNLRSAYARAQNSHTSGKEKERRIDDSTGNMLISHPYREHSTEFIRTPRAAPVPLPEDLGHHNGYDSGVPPLFMGESMVIPQPSARKDGAESATAWTDSKKIAGTSPALAQQAVRRAPSRASIEAIDDLEKRREALFAALPPPARRSPTPAQALSPSMYTTSKIISSGATSETEISRQEGGYIDILPQGTRQYQSEDISGSGAISPPIDDYSQFEASRVIIGQSDLLSSATAQERFPIVYGQAFSTTHESQEGEILNASSSADSLSAIARLQRDESKESNRFRDSLTPLREVETSMAMHRSQDVSGSGGSGSASRSISNGSARILDLNEESFTNLFFKAPPPSKPLPSLPSSGSIPHSQGVSTSHVGSTPSPAHITREASPIIDGQERPDSLTISERYPTPDFSVLNALEVDESGSQAGNAQSNRESRRESSTHSFARVATGHPHPRGGRLDDDLDNVDESFLRDDRQIWPPVGLEEEDNEELLQPPPMARNFTSSTAHTVDTFYTAGVGAQSNASTSAFKAPALSHQESFASARSHITASSAARTPQAEFAQSQPFPQDRGQFIDDTSEDEREDPIDPMATIRRTALSPIFVQRPPIPAQMTQQHAVPQQVDSADAGTSQPPSGRGSDVAGEASRRDSFIEFEPVIPVRPRAPSDTRSFIEDDSDDENDMTEATASEAGKIQAEAYKNDRPSVIVEHTDVEQNSSGLSDSLSPYSPLYAATSPSHYSVTPSEIIDTYRNQMHDSSGAISRDSQGGFSLGLPVTPRGGDRNSGGSHTHSVSNVSILSSLSKLEDFPEPPASVTPAYEKDESAAMMQHHPSVSTLGDRDASSTTLRARGSSLPGGPHNQSRATINTQGTQTTSIYTFSSSAEGSGGSGQNIRESEASKVGDEDTSSPKRPFEFPMRRGSSKRSTVDSFLDTTTSPERGNRSYTSSLRPLESRVHTSSSSTSPDPRYPVREDRFTPSPSQQSFRLSGIFTRRPKHERTSSDPSAINSANSRKNSLNVVRRDSGGFENQEEKRQSWKGF